MDKILLFHIHIMNQYSINKMLIHLEHISGSRYVTGNSFSGYYEWQTLLLQNFFGNKHKLHYQITILKVTPDGRHRIHSGMKDNTLWDHREYTVVKQRIHCSTTENTLWDHREHTMGPQRTYCVNVMDLDCTNTNMKSTDNVRQTLFPHMHNLHSN